MGRNDKAVEQMYDQSLPLGARMRLKRQEKRISLTEMAELLGYTKSHLSSVENGKGRPSQELVEGYERKLGLALGEFNDFQQGDRSALGSRHTPIYRKRQAERVVDDQLPLDDGA